MSLTSMGRLGWDPLAEMRRMQSEMNRLFADLETRPQATSYPPINIWVGEDSAVVTAELPGVAEKDIDLSVREDTLTIQGRRNADVASDQVGWHRRERLYGGFSRVVELPFRIDPEKVKARYSNGILEIELQRPEAEKPKRIRITAN